MKVIVPTMMESRWETVEGQPAGQKFEVMYYNKYEFTLEEAMEYLNMHPYEFEDFILHNVGLRNVLREIGAAQLVAELRKIIEPSAMLDTMMKRFETKWIDKPIADFDIQVYPIATKVNICGHTFDGLEEIQRLTEISGTGYLNQYITKKDIGCEDVHVGQIYQRYPCFDSSDYAYENRYYQNYLIRKEAISEQDVYKALAMKSQGNEKRVHELTPAKMLPMVYYKGEGGFMLIATNKDV